MEWMILPFRRYAQFSGRSRRKEFWMYILFLIIATIVLSIIDAALGLGGSARTTSTLEPGMTGFGGSAGVTGGILTGIFSLATIIPTLAVQVRRLHDTNRSGWWILFPLVPYVVGFALMIGGSAGGLVAGNNATAVWGGALMIGGIMLLLGGIAAIALLVFMCLDGTHGPNRFGPDPKNPEANLGEVFR